MSDQQEPHEIVVVEEGEPRTVIAQPDNSVMALMRLALERGGDVATLERLVALQEHAADRAAAREFAQAMADFQAKCPPIQKRSKASIVTSGGAAYGYTYAELDEIARTINPICAALGLSYTWDSKVEGASLSCVCTVRHINGHSITASFVLPTTTKSGMSDQQRVAAALTYARRQSLVQAFGLTTAEPDMDGAEVAGANEPVSEEQATTIQALMEEVGADKQAFLAYIRAESVGQIAKRDYRKAVTLLERKRDKGRAKKGAGK